MDKERTERNFFQLERDKVNSFWEISQRQLDEARATIRNKERELGDSEERHQVEIKVRIPLLLEESTHVLCITCTHIMLWCRSTSRK